MNYTKVCPTCGANQTYRTKDHLQRAIKKNTNCNSCAAQARPPRTKVNRISRKCVGCGKSFEVLECQLKWNPAKFCSKQCYDIYQTVNNEGVCQHCQTKFVWRGRKSRKFCSVTCANSWIYENVRISKAEEKVADILSSLKVVYKRQFSLDKKMNDFLIPNKKLILEIDGVYWHAKDLEDDELNQVQQINRTNDVLKNKIAKFHGYKLKRMWEDEISVSEIKRLVLKGK